MSEPRKFTLELKEEEFLVGDKTYIMREMDGSRRDSYNQAMSERMVRDANGKPLGLRKITGMDADLLIRCVFDPETDKFVDSKTVQSWPSGMLEDLGNWALEFNSLDRKAEERAKNALKGSEESGGE